MSTLPPANADPNADRGVGIAIFIGYNFTKYPASMCCTCCFVMTHGR